MALGPWGAAGLAVAAAVEPASHDLSARVRTAGTRAPLGQVRVLVVPEPSPRAPGPVPTAEHLDPEAPPPWVRTGTTDDEGNVELDDLPAARVRVVVLAPGHERLEVVVDLARPGARALSLWVMPSPAAEHRTVVEGEEREPPGRVTSRTLSPEEIATAPGTQGDPLRALQNFPGVARAPGGLGLLVLRGAAPNQSRVFYGEHALPRAFHALAFSSIVPADAMSSIEFMPSNAPSRYGDTTGGVVAIEPRHLPRDGVHGHAEVDLAGTGALVRGPLGKGAFLVGAQRGWVDGVLRVVEKVDETASFTLPNYYDYQALLDYPLPGRQTIGVRILGAGDRVQTRVFDPEEDRHVVPLQIGTHFHRADLVYRARRGPWSFLITPTFRFETSSLDIREGPRDVRRDYATGWRAEVGRILSRRADLTVGVDGEVTPFATTRTIRGETPSGEEVIDVEKDRGRQSSLGAYVLAEVRFGTVTLYPGLRANAYVLGDDVAGSVDPRFTGRWDLSDRWAWRFGVGLYSQPVVAQRVSDFDFLSNVARSTAGNVVLPASITALEPRAGFQPAAGSLRLARAAQASTGVEVRITDRWSMEGGLYGRLRSNEDGVAYVGRLDDLTRFLDDETYAVGYGLELMARLNPGGKLYGWLAYTLSRSEIRFLDALQGPGTPRNGPFDQRHILAVLASYALPKRWRIGGRFRIVSGSPYTPIVGVVDLPASGDTQVVVGAANSARFPVFHQLDIRVDKRWIRPRTIFTLYLDVQNVYNRTNVEAYVYDSSFRERINAVGLPIFPSLGFRIDF